MIYYSAGSLTLRVCDALGIKYPEANAIIQKHLDVVQDCMRNDRTHDEAAQRIAEAHHATLTEKTNV